MSTDRRGFLARLGAIATAPVLTAYEADKATGLAVPSRDIVPATEVPPPLVISSSTGRLPIFGDMLLDDEVWPHDRMHTGDGTLTFIVDGESWVVPAFRASMLGRRRRRR